MPLLIPGMISDLNGVEGGPDTKKRIPVRFSHAPRVNLTLEKRPTIMDRSVDLRILRLHKHIPPKASATFRAMPAAPRP